jgi:hypothetical protein
MAALLEQATEVRVVALEGIERLGGLGKLAQIALRYGGSAGARASSALAPARTWANCFSLSSARSAPISLAVTVAESLASFCVMPVHKKRGGPEVRP